MRAYIVVRSVRAHVDVERDCSVRALHHVAHLGRVRRVHVPAAGRLEQRAVEWSTNTDQYYIQYRAPNSLTTAHPTARTSEDRAI